MREGGLRGVGEEVVGGMLSDIHFVVIKGVDREVAGRMRRVRVDGLVKVVGKESSRRRVVRQRGRGGRIYGHETVSGYATGFEDLAEFPGPTSVVRTGRWRIRRVHSKVRSGIGRETPSRSACHVQEKGRCK